MIDLLPSRPSVGSRRRTGHPLLGRLVWRAALAVALLGSGAPAYAQTWTDTLGNIANKSLADVVTLPARSAERTVSGLGTFAAGVGPVIGSDGTAYLANFEGELRAIRSDGSQAWLRKVLSDQHVVASPVIGADGSIYLVGSKAERIGDVDTYDTTLYSFHPGGAMRWSVSFPNGIIHNGGTYTAAGAPKVWRFGTDEVVVVPAAQQTYGGHEVRLLAFSTTGALLFNQTVTSVVYEINGGPDPAICWIFQSCFGSKSGPRDYSCEADLPHLITRPLPSAAIFASSGKPVVIVADSFQYIVGYAFSPASGFEEYFRKHITSDAIQMSAPAAVRDGHSLAIGWSKEHAWLLFAGPNLVNWTEIALPPNTRQTPTLTADGRIITLSAQGLAVSHTFPNVELFQTVVMPFAGESARAAASHNHLFISTCSALLTLDADTFKPLVQFDWVGGGAATPAIGADGRVYALAGSTLFIFPAPPPGPCPHCGGNLPGGGGGGVLKP